MKTLLIFGVAFTLLSLIVSQAFAGAGNTRVQPVDRVDSQAIGQRMDGTLDDEQKREFAERINNRGFVPRMGQDFERGAGRAASGDSGTLERADRPF